MTRTARAARLTLLLFVVTPIAAWFFVKPLRVVAPTLAGVTCLDAGVCLDDPTQFGNAAQLRKEAMAFVSAQVSPLAGQPRVIFCATDACAHAFGLGDRSAITVGTIGTVIGPRAWKPYYVRHELIHQLQAERLGTLAMLLKPKWFVEGMAYALSEDPRPTLTEPWQSHRARFRAWYAGIDPQRLWQQAP
ncbi:MAG: hypothetical protein V4505_22295 [Pseudomonadota bacterium]